MQFIKKNYYIIKKKYFILINDDIKNFKILAAGVVLSQFIGFISVFFITRLYSPEILGNFAIFLAIVTMCSSSVSGGYEIAIVTSRVRNEVNILLVSSIILSFLTSVLIFVLLFFFEIQIKTFLNANKLKFWWLFIPFLIYLQSVTLIIKSYANRYKAYYVISKILVIKSMLSGIIIVFFGLANLTSYGLYVGELLSSLIVVLIFFLLDKKKCKKIIWSFNCKALYILKKYKEFPIFNASARFIDNLILILPIFFLNKYFNNEIVGYFTLCIKVIFIPFAFISYSISILYLKKVTEQINKKKNSISYFFKLSFFLLGIIFLPSIILFLFGPQIFILVFGNEWMLAGKFIQILIPSLAMQFIVSTLSPAISATLNNKLYALQTVVSLISTLFFFLFFPMKFEIIKLLYYFNILNLILYSLYYFLIFFSISYPKKKI